jgi:hypothetical protein
MAFENEKVVEIKSCKLCQASFDITDKDLEFYEKVSPTFWWKKYIIPSPTLCPICREQRRFSARNERHLYKRKCDGTGNDILSIYSPDKKCTVYASDYWWSDAWDPLTYGRDFDFSRPFFEQFHELVLQVPLLNLLWANNHNSEYINLTADCKNCYIVMESSNDEDCYYGYWLQQSKNCCDCSFIHQCENSYEIQNCFNCYNLLYSNNCEDCSDSWYINDCKGCKNCFFCVNLVNQEYCILNKQYSKEEYMKIKENIFLNFKQSTQIYITEFDQLSKDALKKYAHVEKIENSTGDYLKNVKNCINCFHSYDAEDCKYGKHTFRNAKDVMDADTVGRDAHQMYEVINSGISVANNLFVAVCWNSHHLMYCFHCFNAEYLFWCVGLTNKKYCIFNKQYTQQEYEILVPKLIEHMNLTPYPSPLGEMGIIEFGEFFPSSISLFGYNETDAMDYYPITREDALCHSGLDPESIGGNNVYTQQDPETSSGWQDQKSPLDREGYPQGVESFKCWPIFNWSDYVAPFVKVEKIIPASKLPERIEDIPDDILNWSIECEATWRPYRIIKQELEFYRFHKLPIPRKHPDVRHSERLHRRNPWKLYDGTCSTCWCSYKTTFLPDQKNVVCETCFNKVIYW